MVQNYLISEQYKYSSHLYSQTNQNVFHVKEVLPIYQENAEMVDARIILRDNFDTLFSKYNNVFIFGEDSGSIGDVNQGLVGLQEKYGKLRVADTGIREATIIGQGIGMALRGLRPIAEIQYLDYLLYAIQILSDDLSTLQYRTSGTQKAPLIVRTRGHRLEGIWHSGSPMGAIVHLLRGMHILVPRNMTKAAGFYNTLLECDEPALIVENLNGYRLKEKLPSNLGEFKTPIGVVETIKEGKDITVVSYGSTLKLVQDVVNRLLQVEIDIEIIDVQSLLPFDINQDIVKSIQKTNRLIIIDEEHRFGVKQKESLKKIRGQSDILTMTATPIPRSLNMALGSLKELSIIASPPAKRTAIQTFVDQWNDNTIVEACSREIHRGGQIFVVHNDIDSIDNMAESLRVLMPNLKIRIAHGQMPSKELEQIMTDFYHQRFQVLVCTTIIETGIDIPSANTIIINNAQNFGLAQLHQLRGRVGRSHHKAYAYLVIKSHQSITENAKKRLDAIASLEELGAGFMLANHDLEIRGAGDLLGENQSGKISEIGFNLYHDLLKRTIHAIKNNKQLDIKEALTEEVEINPGIACIIPDTYLPDVHERLILYKRIASANNEEELKDLKIEMIDRFGLLPDSTSNLFESSSLKNYSNDIGVLKINIYDDKAEITLNEKNSIDTSKIINLIQTKPHQFQLKNQKTLIVKEVMEADQFRIKKISDIVKSLV